MEHGSGPTTFPTIKSRPSLSIQGRWPSPRRSPGSARGPATVWSCCPIRGRPRSTSRATIRLWRSEEHTSELQSHSDLVCRLLLEKKKKVSDTNEDVQHQHIKDNNWM